MAVRRVVFHGGKLASGTFADVAVNPSTGLIEVVGSVTEDPSDERIDCRGSIVLTSAVDSHAHLDKALSSRDVTAMPLTLVDAVNDWKGIWPKLTHADMVDRATEAVEAMVANGTTIIRSHVDVGENLGLKAIHAIVEVRERMKSRGLADVQVVALAAPPMGDLLGSETRRLLEASVDAGIDVIGGSPDLDEDPLGATIACVKVAQRSGLPLDLHSDQSIDPNMFWVSHLPRLVHEYGLTNVVASHCVSLSMQPLNVQHRVAREFAEAGIAVTTMPLTSLFYFGWDQPVAPPRGLTAIRVLREEGVVVAAGADNVQDVFFPFGRFDPMETASVLAMAAHLSPAEAWDMSTNQGRLALGLAPTSVAVGQPADLLVIKGNTLGEAMALASADRVVVRHGRVVARTTTENQRW